jgi:hypothetical protein
METTPEISSLIDGMTLCIRKGKEVKTGSFGNRSRAVDNGFAIAMAQCCVYYCQEQGKNRGHLLELIPEDLRGSKEMKKQSTELFGKIRTSYKKDENKNFMSTLIWLFNKWAQQHANTIGYNVMRCQKIGWRMVKDKAIPHKITTRKVKGKTVSQTLYTNPKNIGTSPLCSPQEKLLLKSLAHIGYHDPMKEQEEQWKMLSAKDQHDHFDSNVKTLRELHSAYNDTASRICGRQYRRRKYFERVTNEELATSKKKKPDPKAVSKHLADLTKKVFSDSKLEKQIPLATSSWVLIVNTILEDVVTEIVGERVDLTKYFDGNRAKQLKSAAVACSNNGKTLATEHEAAFKNFISTNQYSVLDDDDDDGDDDGEPPQEEGDNS